MDHLVDLGHGDIVFLREPHTNIFTSEPEGGLRDALSCHGFALPDTRIWGSDFTLEEGFAAAEWVLGLPERPTAVICAFDQIAIGLMSGLAKAGLNVPADMSIVGFDDIVSAAYVSPSVTTIRQDRIGLGRTAAKVILKQTNKATAQERGICTPPVSLIPQQSSATPRS